MKPRLIIFTDVGDTIIDEGTEVRTAPGGVVYHARCIPGAKETLLELYRRGYTIVMVADGLVESFHNTMRENRLEHVFATEVISEPLAVEKPNALMFQTAMNLLHLTEEDKRRVIMVGNNIKRDVAGANRFGIRSVLLTWSPRYQYEAATPEEVPAFRIQSPEELLPLAEKLNAELSVG